MAEPEKTDFVILKCNSCDCSVRRSSKKRSNLRAWNGRCASCASRLRKAQPRTKHGNYHSRLYKSWGGMKSRCKSTSIVRHLYFDRGIKVYKEWEEFESFKFWAEANGYADNLVLDRVDWNLGYFPGNCRFVTKSYNSSHRRPSSEWKFKKQKYDMNTLKNVHEALTHGTSVAEVSKILDVNYDMVYRISKKRCAKWIYQ